MMDRSDRYLSARRIPVDPVDPGIGRRILGHDDQLMMVEVHFAQGAVGARHHHPHRQVTYVASGTFSVSIGEETRVMETGDCFFVPPDVEHGVVAQDAGVLIDVFAPARTDFIYR